MNRKSARWLLPFLALAVIGTAATIFYLRSSENASEEQAALPVPPQTFAAGVEKLNVPAQMATWPWPGAKPQKIHDGITRWETKDEEAVVELYEFDFGANPRLRWEIYDQDEDDDKPWDNRVDFWKRGIGHVTRDLNKDTNAGPILVGWNGMFFGYDRKTGNRIAFHVAPVVIDGKAHHWGANHRWTFGVKYSQGKPQFKTLFLPDKKTLEREFDYAAGSAQNLIQDGKPLKVEPFPRSNQVPPKQPVKSTPQEAGHIPYFDHMKSCRASLAWTKDNRHLFLIFVKEHDTESGSIKALLDAELMGSGWMTQDVQNFWLAFSKHSQHKIWGAINSDAGDAAQLVMLRNDGKYDFVPERATSDAMRLVYGADFKNALEGGTLMTFYVREAK